VLPALLGAVVLAALALCFGDARFRRPAAAAAVVAVAWAWGGVRLAQLDHSVLQARIGTFERALVEVEEPPRSGSFDQRMRVRVLRWGTLRTHEPVLLGVSGLGDRVGRWLAGDTASGLTGERRDVIEAIVLGRSSGLDQTLLADFRASGLYHCLAVDGLKVAAVGGGVAGVVLFAGLGSYLAQIAALLTVSGYALAVGLHPSVVRAALAAGLGSLAWLAARERDRWQALLVGAAVLLGWNPYSLLDAGFQLSFAAVASIFVVTPRVVRALEGYPVSHEVAQLIGVSTACGLATAPVTWFQFHQISLVTVPANVVAVPVVVEVLALALLTAVVAPVAPPVAAAMAQLNGWGAWLVAVCARAFGSLPGAQITSPRAAAALGLGATGAAAYAWRRGERARAEAGLPVFGERPAEDHAGPATAARADR
jgi:ComEC/Rec2-related protein